MERKISRMWINRMGRMWKCFHWERRTAEKSKHLGSCVSGGPALPLTCSMYSNRWKPNQKASLPLWGLSLSPDSAHKCWHTRLPSVSPLQKKGKMHYQIAVIINFLGHCISMVALLIAFFLFLCLRWVLFFFSATARGAGEGWGGPLNVILEASLMWQDTSALWRSLVFRAPRVLIGEKPFGHGMKRSLSQSCRCKGVRVRGGVDGCNQK